MLLKNTMYTHPYDRLHIAQTSEKRDAHRVNGSSAASSIWNIVKMVLEEVEIRRSGIENAKYSREKKGGHEVKCLPFSQ